MAWRRLGAKIKKLRERRGWTYGVLATKARISRVYLRKLEAGERQSPSFPVLQRLARALGATLTINLVERRQQRRRRG